MTRRVAVALCGAVAVAGLALGLLASGDVRFWGIIAGVFGYVGAFVAGWSLLDRTDARRASLADFAGERGVLLPMSTGKLALAAAYFLSLAFACLVLMAVGVPEFGFLLVVCLGVLAWFLYVGIGPRGLFLTPTRVIVLSRDPRGLAWEDVDRIEIYVAPRGGRSLLIKPERGQRLTVGIDGFVGSGDFVEKTLRRYLKHENRRTGLGTEAELQRIL